MAHLYDGEPDARQQDGAVAVSRFRPRYRALSDEQQRLHDEIKAQAVALEALFRKAGSGRYHSLAITALEQAVMWIVKELTS
jgi:hypothetical protein